MNMITADYMHIEVKNVKSEKVHIGMTLRYAKNLCRCTSPVEKPRRKPRYQKLLTNGEGPIRDTK